MTHHKPQQVASPRAGSWSAVIAIATGAFAIVVLEFVPVGALPQITQAMHVSEGVGGFMVTGPAFVGALAGPAASILIRRLDRRLVLLLLTTLIAVSALVAAASSDFALLMAARLIFGISIGGLFTVGIPAAGGFVEASKSHVAAAIVFAGIGVGSVISVPASELIASSIGWRWAFVGAAVIAGIAFVVQVVFVPKIPATSPVRASDFLELFRSGRTVTVLFVTLLMIGSQFASYTFIVPFLEQITGLSHGAVTPVLLGFGLLTIVGNFGGGTLAGRVIRLGIVLTVVIVTAGVATVAIGGSNTAATMIGLALWGLAWGSVVVTMQQWAHHSSKHLGSPEASNAMLTSAIQFSIAIGSFVGGLIVDGSGVRTALDVAAIAMAAGVLVSLITLAVSQRDVAPSAAAE